jgi:PPOX class probable F420-dependent enzyme
MTINIPESHLNLLTGPNFAVLVTMMPDGQPQSSIVWTDYDGKNLLLTTILERQKSRNMRDNPKVTLLVIDPKDVSRWIEIRGKVAEISEENAEALADKLTQIYTGKQKFYGDIYPVEKRHEQTRVIVKIEPVKVSLDAIFK